MANDPAAIAAKLAALYQPEEPTESDAEQDAEPVGKSSVIPSVGHSPGELTTEQQITLSGGNETDAKHRYLSELIQRNH